MTKKEFEAMILGENESALSMANPKLDVNGVLPETKIERVALKLRLANIAFNVVFSEKDGFILSIQSNRAKVFYILAD